MPDAAEAGTSSTAAPGLPPHLHRCVISFMQPTLPAGGSGALRRLDRLSLPWWEAGKKILAEGKIVRALLEEALILAPPFHPHPQPTATYYLKE